MHVVLADGRDTENGMGITGVAVKAQKMDIADKRSPKRNTNDITGNTC